MEKNGKNNMEAGNIYISNTSSNGFLRRHGKIEYNNGCMDRNINPAMCYISVRPERYSYNIIKETGEFVINLTTKDLAYATDWCGVKSGKNFDKFKEMKLTKEKSNFVKCPAIKESPVSVECRVKEIKELRKSHYVYGGGIINKCR